MENISHQICNNFLIYFFKSHQMDYTFEINFEDYQEMHKVAYGMKRMYNTRNKNYMYYTDTSRLINDYIKAYKPTRNYFTRLQHRIISSKDFFNKVRLMKLKNDTADRRLLKKF